MHREPSKDYIKLLDIKAIIRKWQELDINDPAAIRQIIEVLNRKEQ